MAGKAEKSQSKMHLLDTGQKLGAKQQVQEYKKDQKKESKTGGYTYSLI